MPDYFVGLDLGQVNDYSALAVLERTEQPSIDRPGRHYSVRHLHRWALGTSYPAIVQSVAALLAKAGQGVRVYVLYDSIGSFDLPHRAQRYPQARNGRSRLMRAAHGTRQNRGAHSFRRRRSTASS